MLADGAIDIKVDYLVFTDNRIGCFGVGAGCC